MHDKRIRCSAIKRLIHSRIPHHILCLLKITFQNIEWKIFLLFTQLTYSYLCKFPMQSCFDWNSSREKGNSYVRNVLRVMWRSKFVCGESLRKNFRLCKSGKDAKCFSNSKYCLSWRQKKRNLGMEKENQENYFGVRKTIMKWPKFLKISNFKCSSYQMNLVKVININSRLMRKGSRQKIISSKPFLCRLHSRRSHRNSHIFRALFIEIYMQNFSR